MESVSMSCSHHRMKIIMGWRNCSSHDALLISFCYSTVFRPLQLMCSTERTPIPDIMEIDALVS